MNALRLSEVDEDAREQPEGQEFTSPMTDSDSRGEDPLPDDSDPTTFPGGDQDSAPTDDEDDIGAATGPAPAPSGTSRRRLLEVLAVLGLGTAAASEPASAASPSLEFGGNYTSDPGSDFGLRLEPSGARFGMLGFSGTSDGRGLVGRATSASGATVGVLGRAESPDGVAIQGQNDATSGPAFGGLFRTFSPGGRGFLGIAEASSGAAFGAIGKSRSVDGVGVEGNATAGSGSTVGVRGIVDSPDGYGLHTPDDAEIEGELHVSDVVTPAASPLALRNDEHRVFEIDGPSSGEYVNVIAGAPGNEVADGIEGATISGGGWSGIHVPEDPTNNLVHGDYGTVGGGHGNRAFGTFSVVSGGDANGALGKGAIVPGGIGNTAKDNSFAAGLYAKAADASAFVWNDGSEYHTAGVFDTAKGLSSAKDIAGSGVTGDNTFHASAQGGFRFVTGPDSVTYISGGSTGWATTSTRAAKTDVRPVDARAVLSGVADMEVSTWEYEGEDGEGRGERHIGPMAEDFHDVVDVGHSDDHINSINADGVLFAAVKGLNEKLERKDDRIEELEAESADLRAENEALRGRLDDLEGRVAELEGG